MSLSRASLFVATSLALFPARTQGSDVPVFPATEGQKIIALGPWPPVFTPDPTNRVSGNARAIELGRRLFSDSRMSPVGYIGCVTCHQPDRAFTDLRPRAHALADLQRNTPALFNLRQQRWYGWAGASDSLWMASVRPMLDAREFDSSPAFVARVFERDPELAACYRKVFHEPPRKSRRTVVNVGKALAAFEETLVTGRTPFDEFRDALKRGDTETAKRYPAAAQRGLKVFVSAANCIACHRGANFSDGDFHALTLEPIGADAAAARASFSFAGHDRGRLDDLRIVTASPFNLRGPYNDDPSRTEAAAISFKRALPDQFRTPSLRNIATTGPYMHDGRFERLEDALRHGPQRTALRGGNEPLTTEQVADLAAFLATLTDRYAELRPWPSIRPRPCP